MLKILPFLFIAISAQASPVFDPPDLNLEYQLHRAYTKSIDVQAEPTSQDGWIENYNVQSGESLWNLSQMLYGDGAYWPKVWAQNPKITNPHLVRQGHTLELLLGSEDQAPAFRFSEEGDSGLELTAATTTANSTIEVPAPEIAPRPVIGIPKSFPAWQSIFKRNSNIITVDDSKLKRQNFAIPDKLFLNGYVQDGEISSIGSFLETELESGLPVANQHIYVKLKKGSANVGDHLLVVQDHGKLQKLNEQVEGKVSSHFVEVFGDLQLLEVAQSSLHSSRERRDYDVYRALMLHVTGLTLTNFDLIPGQIQALDLTPSGPPSPTSAQVIGSTKHKTSALYGPGDIIFLNRGSKDGLAAGQMMELHIDRSIRDTRTAVTFSGRSSGNVKVVRVDENCSTAIILTSVDGILQGDRVQGHMSYNSNGDQPGLENYETVRPEDSSGQTLDPLEETTPPPSDDSPGLPQ